MLRWTAQHVAKMTEYILSNTEGEVDDECCQHEDDTIHFLIVDKSTPRQEDTGSFAPAVAHEFKFSACLED